MTLNRVKLGRAVTFMKYFACVISLIFLAKTLEQNHVPDIEFPEFCRAGWKWTSEDYLQKIFTNIPVSVRFNTA